MTYINELVERLSRQINYRLTLGDVEEAAIAALERQQRDLKEAGELLRNLKEWLVCDEEEQSYHYCPNCCTGLHKPLDMVNAFLARVKP